jgi:hypothetical protein
MNWVFLFVGVVGFLGCGAAFFYGLSRIRGIAGPEPSQERGGAPPGRATLADFGDDLLAQKLARLHSQPAFYDRCIDGLGARLTFWQFRGLVAAWRRFFSDATEAAGTQNDFVRRTAERSTIVLEAEKTQSTLRADREEQRVREEKAWQERMDLGKERKAPPAESSQDPFKKKTEEFTRRMQSIDETQAEKIRDRVGEKPENQWTEDEREYVERVKNFCDRERGRLMERG